MKKYIRNFRPAGFQKGDLNPSRKPERRLAISEWRKKQTTSEETKKRISISMKKALENPKLKEKWSRAATGRKPSLETKEKIVATRQRNHPISMKGLVTKVDALFSRYKRLSNTNDDGKIKCFTCERYFVYADMDCGHYVSRSYKSTRWLDENAEPQCRSCNRFHEGVKDVFALNLIKKHGQDILQQLSDKKRQIKKFTIDELAEIKKELQQKIKEME